METPRPTLPKVAPVLAPDRWPALAEVVARQAAGLAPWHPQVVHQISLLTQPKSEDDPTPSVEPTSPPSAPPSPEGSAIVTAGSAMATAGLALGTAGLAMAGAAPPGVVVGCSGGADSVALTLVASCWLRRQGIGVTVAHFDHGAREDSSRVAAWVAALAAALNLPLVQGTRSDPQLPPPQSAQQVPEDNPLGPTAKLSETVLREARMGFFRSIALGRPVVLAHHRDDAVETLLLRLARGSGLAGLAAPRPVQALGSDSGNAEKLVLWRPWLDVPRATLRTLLEAAGVPWCEDPTNTQPITPRNRLRREVLPRLESLECRGFSAGAARSHHLLREDAEALEAWADAALPAFQRGKPAKIAAQLPMALRRRAFWRWWHLQLARAAPPFPTLASETVEAVLAAWATGSPAQWSAASGWLITDAQGSLSYRAAAPGGNPTHRAPTLPCRLMAPFQLAWPPNQNAATSEAATSTAATSLSTPVRWLEGQVRQLSSADRETIAAGRVNPASEVWLAVPDAVQWPSQSSEVSMTAADSHLGLPEMATSPAPAGMLEIGPALPGDRFWPLGAPGRQPLAEALRSRGVNVEARRSLPVIRWLGEVAWVPGLPPAEPFRIRNHSSWAIRLTYRSDPMMLPRSA